MGFLSLSHFLTTPLRYVTFVQWTAPIGASTNTGVAMIVIPHTEQSYFASHILLARAWSSGDYDRVEWLLNAFSASPCDRCGARTRDLTDILGHSLCESCIVALIAQQS